jgi:hypothetical protein
MKLFLRYTNLYELRLLTHNFIDKLNTIAFYLQFIDNHNTDKHTIYTQRRVIINQPFLGFVFYRRPLVSPALC